MPSGIRDKLLELCGVALVILFVYMGGFLLPLSIPLIIAGVPLSVWWAIVPAIYCAAVTLLPEDFLWYIAPKIGFYKLLGMTVRVMIIFHFYIPVLVTINRILIHPPHNVSLKGLRLVIHFAVVTLLLHCILRYVQRTEESNGGSRPKVAHCFKLYLSVNMIIHFAVFLTTTIFAAPAGLCFAIHYAAGALLHFCILRYLQGDPVRDGLELQRMLLYGLQIPYRGDLDESFANRPLVNYILGNRIPEHSQGDPVRDWHGICQPMPPRSELFFFREEIGDSSHLSFSSPILAKCRRLKDEDIQRYLLEAICYELALAACHAQNLISLISDDLKIHFESGIDVMLEWITRFEKKHDFIKSNPRIEKNLAIALYVTAGAYAFHIGLFDVWDEYQQSKLQRALHICQVLLECPLGNFLSKKSPSGKTLFGRSDLNPLHSALDNSSMHVVNMLLADYNFDPDQADNHGRTPLQIALDPSGDRERKNLELTEILLLHGAHIDSEWFTLLFDEEKWRQSGRWNRNKADGLVRITKALVDHGARVDDHWCALLADDHKHPLDQIFRLVGASFYEGALKDLLGVLLSGIRDSAMLSRATLECLRFVLRQDIEEPVRQHRSWNWPRVLKVVVEFANEEEINNPGSTASRVAREFVDFSVRIKLDCYARGREFRPGRRFDAKNFRSLFQGGFDPNSRDGDGFSLFDCCVQAFKLQSVFLEEDPFRPPVGVTFGRQVLMDFYRELLAAGAMPSVQDIGFLLNMNLRQGDDKSVLLDSWDATHPFGMDRDGNTLLHLACMTPASSGLDQNLLWRGRFSYPKLRFSLLKRLAGRYPDSWDAVNGDQGLLPVHVACTGDQGLDIVYYLLHGRPDSLSWMGN